MSNVNDESTLLKAKPAKQCFLQSVHSYVLVLYEKCRRIELCSYCWLFREIHISNIATCSKKRYSEKNRNASYNVNHATTPSTGTYSPGLQISYRGLHQGWAPCTASATAIILLNFELEAMQLSRLGAHFTKQHAEFVILRKSRWTAGD